MPDSTACISSARFLKEILQRHDTVYDRKIGEKVSRFLSMSSGKAKVISEVVSEVDQAALETFREELWAWVTTVNSTDTTAPMPTLPTEFPVEYYVLRLGPFSTEDRSIIPTLDAVIPMIKVGSELRTSRHWSRRSGEHVYTVSLIDFETYSRVVLQLGLSPSSWYRHGYHGDIVSPGYGRVPVQMNIARITDIVWSNTAGIKGSPKRGDDQYTPLSEEEILMQQSAWRSAELDLVQQSVLQPGSTTSQQATLAFRRDMLLRGIDPVAVMWDGSDVSTSSIETRSEFIARLPISTGVLATRPWFSYLQNWFTNRVIRYSSPGVDPGPTDEMGRLNYLLSECMLFQEKSANARVSDESSAGGIAKDLATELHALSVYDPDVNPGGIFLFPTYLPSHAVRLVEWCESSLPRLEKSSLHFLHIDSEGYFYQFHTESGGCLIIFTGLDKDTENELDREIRARFSHTTILEDWQSLSDLTRYICRHFTISRMDVAFGGDSAACPLASHPLASRYNINNPWMDSDILGWFWFVGGRTGIDFVCVRSIDNEDLISLNRPIGFKSVVNCQLAQHDTCLCQKYFGKDWVRKCSVFSHPQQWHGYPQSGASKSLANDPLHWTVLYYAISDLVKARSLTLFQPKVDIEIISPFISFE
jgi:hypothetical protein